MDRKIRSDKFVFDLSDIDQIEKMAEIGLNVGEICEIFGIHRDTFYERAKEMPDLLPTVERGKKNGKRSLLLKAHQKAFGWKPKHPKSGDNDMIKFLLSRVHGLAEKQVHEIKTSDLDDKSEAELMEEFERLQALIYRKNVSETM